MENVSKYSENERRLWNLLHNSPKEVITASELAVVFNTSSGNIRHIINSCRHKGLPIISDGYGYYRATEQCQIEEQILSLKQRQNKIGYAIEGLIGATVITGNL